MTERRRIILFGAGEAGKMALAGLKANERVVAITDNSPAKVGTYLYGHPIVTPDRLTRTDHDVILVASMYWREIIDHLETLGYEPAKIEVAEVSRAPALPKSEAKVGTGFTDRDAWSLISLDSRLNDYQPLVSIILPTYNRRTVLPRTVQSVLAQTYTRFELIIIDDGSTDGTHDLLDTLSRQDDRIHVNLRDHTGVSATRNAGLKQAKGDLVAYLDSDNRWHPYYLQLMISGFRDKAWSTGYAGINIFDETSGRYRCNMDAFDFERLLRSNYIDLNVFMHRLELVEEFGGFNDSMTRLVDWDLVLRYTRRYTPFVLRCILADYFISADARRISDTEPYLANHDRMSDSLKRPSESHPRTTGPLHIAFVLYEFPALSQTFVQNEISYLMDLGVKVSVFYLHESSIKGTVPDDLYMVKIATRDHLVHLLVSRRVDLVHTHFALSHIADLIMPVCERLNLPFTQKPHAYDIFRNNQHPRHHISRSGSHPQCKLVYCLGEYHRRFLASEGVPVDKLKVTRNIFDLSAFRAPEISINERVQHIVSISRFVEKKGYHLLIEAFQAIDDPSLRLELYGYGEEKNHLFELARDDSRIAIKEGPRCIKEAVPLFRNADLFALPCVVDRHGDTDGLPTVLMEAMAAGVPVLTTPLSSIPDLVVHEETGFLVESNSVEALITCLHEVLQSSPARRECIAKSAWAHLDREFDPVINTKSILTDWRLIVDSEDRVLL